MALSNKLCIAIDGVDRIGKSTLLNTLTSDFESLGYKVVLMSNNSDQALQAAKKPFNDFYKAVDNSLVYDVIGSSQLTTMTTAIFHISRLHEKVVFIFDRLWVSSYVNGTVLRSDSFKNVWNSPANYISYANAFVQSIESMGIQYANFVFTSSSTFTSGDSDNELITLSTEDLNNLNTSYKSISKQAAKYGMNVHNIDVAENCFADIAHVRSTLGYKVAAPQLKTKTILQPRMLLSVDRFDIFIKLAFINAYVKHRANMLSFETFTTSREYVAYIDHINVFNGFNEPGNPEKNSPEKFVSDFIEIIESVKSDTFDWSRSPIPVEFSTSKVCNGAHRLAAACYWNKPVIIVDAVGRGIDGVRHVHYNGILANCTNETKHIGFVTMNNYSYGRNK